jgi:hypothetical protein
MCGRLARFNKLAIVSQCSPEDSSLNAESYYLDCADYHQPHGKRREPPAYLQFLIGVGLAGVFGWWGGGALISKRFAFGWLLLLAGLFFGCCAFSAVLYGSWFMFWRELGL